jgi:hypothetical protein
VRVSREREKEVNIHGRTHCTHNSGYNKANKDILVLKVREQAWEQGKEGLGGKNVNKEIRITVSQKIHRQQ